MLIESADDVRASFESADNAIKLWKDGKREQALSNLLATFESNPLCGPDWSWLAATWQMVLGLPTEQALSVIRRYPSYVPEWYYANALCLYAQLGDTEISRSALLAALLETRSLGRKLLGRSTNETRPDVELEGSNSYPEHAGVLWTDKPEVRAWLESGFTSLTSWIEAPPIQNADNIAHHKLWLNNYEIGVSYLKRGERKKARTSLLSALRDARKIGILGQEFDQTLTALVAGELEAEEQVKRALKDLVEAIQQLGDTDRLNKMRAYKRAGDYYSASKLLADSDRCYRAATDILKQLNDDEKAVVSLIERAELLEESAAFWIKDGVIRSTALYEEALELRTSFLGEHSEVMDLMLELHKCLICQDETEERTAALEARMQRIIPEAKELIEEHHGELL
jgi:tetratricopeptide (TPR) repeat protein